MHRMETIAVWTNGHKEQQEKMTAISTTMFVFNHLCRQPARNKLILAAKYFMYLVARSAEELLRYIFFVWGEGKRAEDMW